MFLCLKCQNDSADHTTEYCPTHTCKNCGGSGHVSKVCPKKGTTQNPNQTSNQSVRKNPGMSKQNYPKTHNIFTNFFILITYRYLNFQIE